MPSYTVLSPLQIDGKRKQPDAKLELDQDAAQPLLDAGVLAAASLPSPSGAESAVPPSPSGAGAGGEGNSEPTKRSKK